MSTSKLGERERDREGGYFVRNLEGNPNKYSVQTIHRDERMTTSHNKHTLKLSCTYPPPYSSSTSFLLLSLILYKKKVLRIIIIHIFGISTKSDFIQGLSTSYIISTSGNKIRTWSVCFDKPWDVFCDATNNSFFLMCCVCVLFLCLCVGVVVMMVFYCCCYQLVGVNWEIYIGDRDEWGKRKGRILGR